eukprot:TRINITY_DN14325_c0_g2_i2.p1 TRINITY_DN14325_c0_g2~~TRINITY_DN14325_c0_g2_i2.p1  ORF type:complete len:610 (+),score=137.84 TRINITY_DN14325_c0_g2_i2:197-1831(+)
MSPMFVASSKSFYILPFLALSVFAKYSSRQFLGARPIDARGPADLLAELQSEEHLMEFDHASMTTARTERLEAALLPLFKIASNDVNGRVDANAARYLLHRLFANRHGWFVNALEAHDVNTSASQVGQALYGSGESFSLRQIARFAAALETLVHAENIKRLQQVFSLHDYSRDKAYDEHSAKKVIEAYMVYFLTIALPDEPFDDLLEYCERIPEWPDTLLFVEEVRKNVVDREEGGFMSLWNLTLQVVEEIGERYGKWQNKQCVELKSKLMQMELPGTGRVPLSNFWKPFLKDERWPFVESVETLETMGALDNREPEHPFVIIPNYVYSTNNCLAGSTYYDVCCLNECETILGEIERQISAPAATPQRLAELLSKLPSSTVEAPRVLPATLLQRLENIASQYQGLVPLHGRLFAQVLHHIYPRECPFPQVSRTNLVEDERRDMRVEEDARVSQAYVMKFARTALDAKDSNLAATNELPWTEEEEIFLQSLSFDPAGGAASEVTMLVPVSGLLVALALVLRFNVPLLKLSVFPSKGKGSASSYCV